MITAMSSSDSAVPRRTLARLCVSEADTTASSSVRPLSSARIAPRRLGTSAEYRTDGARVIPCHTSLASAICGIASGRTNETASILATPVPDSRSISSILASVGTGSSFCSPSLGPTSRTEILAGRSLTAMPLLLMSGGWPGPRCLPARPGGIPFLCERCDALFPIPGAHRGPPGRVLDVQPGRQRHPGAVAQCLLGGPHRDRGIAGQDSGQLERGGHRGA